MLGLPFGEEKAQFRRSGDLASELCDPPPQVDHPLWTLASCSVEERGDLRSLS